ncbi:MAG: hypothetical protein ABW120_04555 [Sedimenticola sp.]
MDESVKRIIIGLASVLIVFAILWAALNGLPDTSLFNNSDQHGNTTSFSDPASSVGKAHTEQALSDTHHKLISELEKLNQKAKALSSLSLDEEIAQADALIEKINKLIGDVGLTENLAEERRQLLLERQAELQARMNALPQNEPPPTQ